MDWLDELPFVIVHRHLLKLFFSVTVLSDTAFYMLYILSHCSRWRHNWKSAQVVSSHLVCDPTIRQPGFHLPRQQWSLLNRFRREQRYCGACRRKWRLTDTVSLWRDPDDVSRCRILSPDKTEWQIISATLCGWRCCFVADQLWFMTCIQEEKEQSWESQNNLPKPYIV